MAHRPGPELTPQKYWLRPDGDEPGIAMFMTDRDRVLVLVAMMGAPLAIALFVMIIGPFIFGAALLLFVCLLGGGLLIARTRTEAPPSGLWAVDEDGWPVRFITSKPPPDLRRDRGLTREAFVQSLRGQTSSER